MSPRGRVSRKPGAPGSQPGQVRGARSAVTSTAQRAHAGSTPFVGLAPPTARAENGAWATGRGSDCATLEATSPQGKWPLSRSLALLSILGFRQKPRIWVSVQSRAF